MKTILGGLVLTAMALLGCRARDAGRGPTKPDPPLAASPAEPAISAAVMRRAERAAAGFTPPVLAALPVLDAEPAPAGGLHALRPLTTGLPSMCGPGFVLCVDPAGDLWVQQSQGFTGFIIWHGPVSLDRFEELCATARQEASRGDGR